MSQFYASPGPQVVAVANQKGGVGKTTTTVNLGAALAVNGITVLIIDLDPQGNASTGFGISRRDRFPGTYNCIAGRAPPADCIRPSGLANLTIIPAEADLAGAEIELVSSHRREYCLEAILPLLHPVDVILIDCPPSLGLLTLNGLVAATSILVPLQCEFFALEGLSQLAQTIDRVRVTLNPRAAIDGIVLTMFDRRNNLSELVAADARSFFGDRVYDTTIPRSIRVSEAPSHGRPVIWYDPKSAGAQAYTRLAREFQHRLAISPQLTPVR